MNAYVTYGIIFVILFALELAYFRIADRFNIIDRPNERSSHSTVVLRGGGVIFLVGAWIWAAFFGVGYPLFLVAVTLAAGVSFVDDVRSLPDGVRLVVQFVAMGLLIGQLWLSARAEGLLLDANLLVMGVFVVAALIVCVGATNVYNFMDGINGITAAYSLAVLVPLLVMNARVAFMEGSLLVVTVLAVLVFGFFNFRPRGKARCFAGDVGSVGIAFILLFAIGMLIVRTEDITWLIFLLVYGVDGCLTIVHRIMLHENLGQAHRKHAYQLMANELGMSHPVVSLIYMALQLVVSLGFVFVCPDSVLWHWAYLAVAFVVLAGAYVGFMRKWYWKHEEWLKGRG